MSKTLAAVLVGVASLLACIAFTSCDDDSHRFVPAPVDGTISCSYANGEVTLDVVLIAADQLELVREDDPEGHSLVVDIDELSVLDRVCPGAYVYLLKTIPTEEGEESEVVASCMVDTNAPVEEPAALGCGALSLNLVTLCYQNRTFRVLSYFVSYYTDRGAYLGECRPESELCNDGIDNDFDGLVDCDDDDCIYREFVILDDEPEENPAD